MLAVDASHPAKSAVHPGVAPVVADRAAIAADGGLAEVTAVDLMRVRSGVATPATDLVALEAPLEIRLGRQPFATIMRTPGRDRALVAGFLLAERLLLAADELGTIAHCTDVDASHPENVMTVTLTGRSAVAAQAALAGARAVVASSACGVCGRRTIDDLAAHCAPITPAVRPADDVVDAMPARLRACQAAFAQTGGLHAAGLFTRDGELLALAEDVGRHNAVDKVVGELVLREQLPASDRVLFVSGRTSFEIVQKAWVAGIPCVASVSAPSSLAIDLARTAGITLIGFVRDSGFNLYTAPA